MKDNFSQQSSPLVGGVSTAICRRNLLLLLGLYLIYGLLVAGSLSFFWSRESWGISLAWDVPVALVAMVLIAPIQHRLLLLGEEAGLRLLCRNRLWNEILGDWLIHFPFSGSTHHTRMLQLTHYHRPNDVTIDGERICAEKAGFFPLKVGKLLRLSALINWIVSRNNYSFLTNTRNPLLDPQMPPNRTALNIGTAFVLIMFAFLITMYLLNDRWFVPYLLATVPPGMWAITATIFWLLPARYYHYSRMNAPYSSRSMTIQRITFILFLNLTLGWVTYLTGRSAVLNYIVLWAGPYVTTTAACQIIRYWRQHGNLVDGQVAHDRKPGLLGKLFIFPLNSQYHTVKHRFPRTPWAELPALAARTDLPAETDVLNEETLLPLVGNGIPPVEKT